MNIHRKKMGFIKSIRDKHLLDYFSTRRHDLQEYANNEQHILSNLQSLFQKLPSSIFLLVQQLDEHFQTVSQFLSKQVQQFSSKMVGTQNVEWCHFVYTINRLLVGTQDKSLIQTIINGSYLPILESAQIQLQKASNTMMESQILKYVLHYCYRLGGYVQSMHQLQQVAMVSTIKRLWDYSWQQEGELVLLQTCYNLFNTNFQAEDEQNITNQQRMAAEITRIKLIKQTFYGSHNEYRLEKILCRMNGLLFDQKFQLLDLYLRLLITFTKYTHAVYYFYPLMKYNILHIIQSILFTHGNYKHQTIVLNLRLLNNLLMNDIQLTSSILKHFMITNVTKLYHQYPDSYIIRQEIAGFMINLTHFLNDEVEIIRELISIGTTQIVIQALELFSKRNDTLILHQGVSSLMIMLNHNPIQVKKLVRQNQKLLRKMLDEQMGISDMVQNVLQSCQLQSFLL